MKKRAFITGITGQDGSYLAEYLLEKGYEVWGLVRNTHKDALKQFDTVKNRNNLYFLHGNLLDSDSIRAALQASKPDELYNLAAQSQPSLSFTHPE